MNDSKLFDAPHHYFATSVAHWLVTTDKRGLADVLAEMDRDGYDYSLWLVPCAWDEDYEIRMYAPQVEGARLVGVFRNEGGVK